MEQWIKIRRVLWGSWYFMCALLVIWCPIIGTPVMMASVFVMWNGQRKRYERVEDFFQKYEWVYLLCCFYHLFWETISGLFFLVIGLFVFGIMKKR